MPHKPGHKRVVKPSKALRDQARKHGVKLMHKRNGKRVYKSESVIRKQLKSKMRKPKVVRKSVHKRRKPVRKTVRFGQLTVQPGMRSVAEIRDNSRFNGREHRPLLIAPFGPPQPWLLKDETPAYSGAPSAFGRRRRRNFRFGNESNSLAGRRVNPSGYLSTWYGFPKIVPPRWNPLLLQGGNNFREGVNDPTLSNVGTAFGKSRRKAPKRRTKRRSK